MISSRLLTLVLTGWILALLPSCKEKEKTQKPPAEVSSEKPPGQNPASKPEPEQASPMEDRVKKASPSTPPIRNASANTSKLPAAEATESSSAARKPDSTPPHQPAPTRRSPTVPSVQMGSKDRDGDLSLVALAKSLTSAIDRAGRAFKANSPDAALSEAIMARRSIPSPAKIAAMGEAAGPNGVIVAQQIESMRKKLDQALERLDRAGAGDTPSVMKNNIVIE